MCIAQVSYTVHVKCDAFSFSKMNLLQKSLLTQHEDQKKMAVLEQQVKTFFSR